MTTINRRRGDTYADDFKLISKATGLPLEISGCSFLLTLGSSPWPASNPSNVYQLIGQVINVAQALVAFAPSAAQADRVGDFFYEIKMTDSAGRIRTVMDSNPYIYT